MRSEYSPVETTVAHESYQVDEWTIEIHDDAMAFAEWRDAFDSAAELMKEHPAGPTTASVHFIDPNLMVIRVTTAPNPRSAAGQDNWASVGQ